MRLVGKSIGFFYRFKVFRFNRTELCGLFLTDSDKIVTLSPISILQYEESIVFVVCVDYR